MMSIYRFIIILAAVVGIGLFTVWQRIEAVRTGYRITELQDIKNRLDEDNRQLRMEVQRLQSTYELLSAADRLGVRLEPYTEMKVEDMVPHRVIFENASGIAPETPEHTVGEIVREGNE